VIQTLVPMEALVLLRETITFVNVLLDALRKFVKILILVSPTLVQLEVLVFPKEILISVDVQLGLLEDIANQV